MRQILLVAIVAATLAAGSRDLHRRRPKRALPPRWSKDVTDLFFVDARTALVGSRPDFAGRSAEPVAASAAESGRPAGAVEGVSRWSKTIAAETLEDEVKAQKLLLDQQLTSLGEFKGGQYRECRDCLSTLAVTFAIIAEYDGTVRWQERAAGMRDRLARAGFNCKVGSDPAYREAMLRKQEISDLVRGDRVEVAAASRDVPWDQVTDVPSLMRRMALAHEQRLVPALANQAQAQRQADTILHESQILAALAQGLQREALDNWDDPTYVDAALRLHRAALDIVESVRQNNYQDLRQAAGEATKACSACHEGYRG